MDGITRTKHFDRRYQQRGITPIVLETLLRYGSARRTLGKAESLTFTKTVLVEIRTDLGKSNFKACERLKNAYVILSDDGSLITVARSYRKAVH